jgi:hypothetical protein
MRRAKKMSSKAVTFTERRSAFRAPSAVPLDLYDSAGHAVVGEGRFVNISERGGLIESKKPLRIRETIRLQIQSAGRAALELSGRIVWARKKAPGFTYGVEFDPVDPETIGALKSA